MSLENTTTINCPSCNKEGDFTIWSSINVQLDPDQKERLLSGELFLYTCPSCGQITRVNYDTLYHDMDKKIMIHSIQKDDDVKDAIKFFNGHGMDQVKELSSYLESLSNYKRRIVRRPEDLAEKIRIFDEGLDDRVIEIIKIMFLQMFYQENQDLEILDLQYVKEDGKNLIIYIAQDESFSSEIEKDLYEVIDDKINQLGQEEDYIIDQAWGLKTFEKLMEEDI